jgi:hypothetical protein
MKMSSEENLSARALTWKVTVTALKLPTVNDKH